MVSTQMEVKRIDAAWTLAFLLKKGHIAPAAAPDRYDITQRGQESLADIEAAGRS